ALNDQEALAAEDEKPLLVPLAVVHRHRLPWTQDRQIDAELVEAIPVFIELAGRTQLVLLPPQLAYVRDEPFLYAVLDHLRSLLVSFCHRYEMHSQKMPVIASLAQLLPKTTLACASVRECHPSNMCRCST